MANTAFGTWGRGNIGDTKLIFVTFDLFTLSILRIPTPPWGPGGLSRAWVLRIPMRVVKGD